jgi:hypothetical protein
MYGPTRGSYGIGTNIGRHPSRINVKCRHAISLSCEGELS